VKTLRGYVLQEWTKVFVVVMLGFPVLVIAIDLTDKLDKYMARGLTKSAVALSYVFAVPEIMFLVLPAAVLFATVFTVGTLGRHSELTAAKASGISFHRLVAPLFGVAIATFLGGILLGELVPITSSRKAVLLGEKQIRATQNRYNFVYRGDAGWVYAIGALEIAPRVMRDLILEREGSGEDYPTIVVAAQRAAYADTGSRQGWMLYAGAVRYLLGPGRELAFAFDSLRARSQGVALAERPEDLLAEPKTPEEMRYAELGRYIDALSRSGSDTKKLTVERALKLAVPFTCIIIALFGAPLAITNPRSGMAWGVAVSLATTFVFLLLVQLSKAVGAGGVLPPTFAAWFPNLLFGGAAVWLLRRTPT
jgi:lipopolysaccharide export system permease protein